MEDVGSMLPAVTQVAQEVNKAGERLLDLMRSELGLINMALQEPQTAGGRAKLNLRRTQLYGAVNALEDARIYVQ
jgi:hypothetical protein